MPIALSDMPIQELGPYHAVRVPGWRDVISDATVRWMGKPLRAECRDLWMLTVGHDNAMLLARLVQRDLWPEDATAPRERYVTTRRQPTFAEALRMIPRDVACYLDASARIDDAPMIARLHPAPSGVNERITWSPKGYHLASARGWFRGEVSTQPRSFADDLAAVRTRMLAEVGPGYDQDLPYLNGSPILAALLGTLVRPAAEAVAHWMSTLGDGPVDEMTVPSFGMHGDMPTGSLTLQADGNQRHVSFLASVGDVRITESEMTGVTMPDSFGIALDARARAGALRLSEITDLPGAGEVPVLSVTAGPGGRWKVGLGRAQVALEPPVSTVPFDGSRIVGDMEEAGDAVDGDAALLLRSMTREQAEFALCCTRDGSSGMHFDVSAWSPPGIPLRIILRDRSFRLEGRRRIAPTEALGQDGHAP